MTFLENPSVKDILNRVESLTKKKVTFIEKNNLKTYAKVKIARSGMSNHYLYYNPDYEGFLSHLIAHECGHILRIFRAQPEKRLMPTPSRNCRRLFVAAISNELKAISKSIDTAINPLIDIWLDGIILQLTNYPEDIKIESWIFKNYPELRTDQNKAIVHQQNQSKQALISKDIIDITPKIIFTASNVMNYVFYKNMREILDIDFLQPFGSWQELRMKGEELFELTKRYSKEEDVADFSMIDRWAEFLELNRWFNWGNFEDIPENYLEI